MLNIPHSVINLTKDKNNILIAGIGGGFDIYGGLPLYHTLQKMGKNVHLANYSFSNFDEIISISSPEIINSDLLAVNDTLRVDSTYFPEGYLARWLKTTYKKDIPIWAFKKTGVIPLKANYKYLVDRLKIDMIILVDGGIDSISTGVEAGSGTVLEDSISLEAINPLEGIEKMVVCLGFGTEVEEKVCGYNSLMNMAEIIKKDGFYGSCSLTKDMESYLAYQYACIHTFDQPSHPTSHIHRRIIPAVEGEFGDFHATDEDKHETKLFISPLMSIYWFFKYEPIYQANKVIPYITDTYSFYEAVQLAVPFITNSNHFPRQFIPY